MNDKTASDLAYFRDLQETLIAWIRGRIEHQSIFELKELRDAMTAMVEGDYIFRIITSHDIQVAPVVIDEIDRVISHRMKAMEAQLFELREPHDSF
jgi:hypothetical protein